MRAILELELRNDHTVQMLRGLYRMGESAQKGLGRAVAGEWPSNSCWVAKITGPCGRFGMARRFLDFKKDFSKANSKGSRGVTAVYILDDGEYYEVNDNGSRYFAKVFGWGVEEISKEEVEAWLRDISESTS